MSIHTKSLIDVFYLGREDSLSSRATDIERKEKNIKET